MTEAAQVVLGITINSTAQLAQVLAMHDAPPDLLAER
jgi:hypothetical protein